MSVHKSATRRLSWLAGSSMIAASLAAFAGLAAAPTTAMAQATCTSPAAPAGNGTTAVTIAAGTYNPGITCSYVGTGSTVTTGGAVTVSSLAGGDGVNLSATGTSAVNWVSGAGTLTAGAQTNGPLIDATSVSGAINITTAAVTATTVGTTHAIRATSTGGGAITISRVGTGIVSNTVAGGVAAIEVVTNGGAINITTTGATNGRQRGILAQTSGTGTVTLALGGGVNANATDGLAAIDTIAGTGATAITLTSGISSGGFGPTIRAVSASTSATAAVNVQNTGGTINGRVDFSGVTAGGVTFNNNGTAATTGRWSATGASVFGGFNDTLTMAGAGANSMASGSSFDFGAGNDTWTLSTTLTAASASVAFGTGNDAFNVSGTMTAADSSIALGDGADTLALSGLLAATTVGADFGTGTDTFNMTGRLAVNGLTLTNLEAFNHSGVLYLGGTNGTATDLASDDVFTMTSGVFTGSGGARVVLDVMPGAGAQTGCATVSVADCLDLRGASSAGVTLLTLNDVNPDAASQGGFDPVGITLVDVAGAGTSAASHFVLDPDSDGYTDDSMFGAAIARPGLFQYVLRYDPTNQRHVLVGLPRNEVLEYSILSGAAQSIWHMTSETVTDRQSNLRTGTEGTVWLRASGDYSRRAPDQRFDSFGQSFALDHSYKLYSGTLMAGMDLISGSGEGYDYVLGTQAGYVGSSFELDHSPSTGRFTGATGGFYGSAWSEAFFLDGTVNGNFLTLDYSSPGLGLKTNTYLYSFGAQAEGGMRRQFDGGLFAEPLASLAFVRTTFEEISLEGGEVRPDDSESLRAAIGLRVGAQVRGASVNVNYFVTGRAWNEFEGQSGGVIRNPGAALTFADEFSGAFGEVDAGLNFFSAAGTVSGFVSTGVKFKDGYSATNLSLGARLAW